jgi:hypothetical protein
MRRRSRWFSLLASCALALVTFGPGAWAQSLEWEASLGFDGAWKQDTWTPVFVDVSNEGDSQAGEIYVPLVERRGATTQSIVNYSLPVELPRHSKKRFVLYVQPRGTEKIYLRAGRQQMERDLAAQQWAHLDDTLVVVLGGERGLLNFLTGTPAAPRPDFVPDYDERHQMGPRADDAPTFHVGHARWDSLPDSWLGWEGVDVVILGDAGFAGASQETLDALLTWVHFGGTLVVPGGALAPQMSLSPIGDLLPIAVRGTATAPHLGALEAWTQHEIERRSALVADGPAGEDALVLCGSEQDPMIAVRQAGAGRIAMTAFDYTSAPIKYWDGQSAMWQRLLAETPSPRSLTETGEHRMPYGDLMTLANAATYTPAAALPPFWLLLGFLGAYIIVLVPVNYSLLKRLDRRELAWVTTPAVVLVFTLGAYGVGYGIRGGAVILNRLAVVETAADTPLARGHGYVGIFSPRLTSYELLLGDTAAGAKDLTITEERTRGPATVRYGSSTVVSDIDMNMWTSRAFGVDFLVDLASGVGGFIEWDGTDLKATVENHTGFDLRDCRIVRRNLAGQKKKISPGGSATWSFGKGTGIGERSWHSFRTRLPQPDAAEGIADIAMRSLFGEMPHRPMGRSWGNWEQPRIVALIDAPLMPVELQRGGAQINDVNLFVANLPLRVAPGRRVPIPHWLVAQRVIATDGSVGRGDPWQPQLTIYDGSAVAEFRIPLRDRGGEAAALTLSLQASSRAPGGGYAGPGAAAGAATLSAYNFRRDEWEELRGALGSVSFPSPADYMGPHGHVLVKMEAGPNGMEVGEMRLTAEVDVF